MLKKLVLLTILSLLCVLYVPQLFKPSSSLLTVFRLTGDPIVIVRGAQGSALTVNISFGEQEVENLLEQLIDPAPLLFVDIAWAQRFPELVEEIKTRSLPVALLGVAGEQYETNPELFALQVKQFEDVFEAKPLWFRTVDEQFPHSLLQLLHSAEINALGSTVHWKDGDLPKKVAGEIIAVPHHRDDQVALKDLKRLSSSRPFRSVEDLLFKPSIKTKKVPE
ncbi:hypothetical protein ORD22_03940 [Sporosarcina sp. GW1-11]|uniref:hypothetical protein n=1 Tax=Sporosarcina sp. GW1-11 TaxID=2899126 RepID=UPI00294E71E8|nr:hypothetical protein [Sporosarcina sp. GW1-11]MDV6377414.1 hypothetical protein [Sporosarcina sp. GW1-11]